MSTAEEGPQPLPDHAGPWTEEAYLALPADRRVELVDGSLLVAPSTDERHDHAVAAVRAAVAAVLPDALEVTGPVALRLAPGRILVPDLVVAARRPDATATPGEVRDSSVALVVIDVVGSGNGVADRWFKPQLYAGSRIPYAVLIDRDEPFAVCSMLISGRYHEYAHAGAGEVLRLEEPFVLELDLAGLRAAPGSTGPPDADPPSAGPDAGAGERAGGDRPDGDPSAGSSAGPSDDPPAEWLGGASVAPPDPTSDRPHDVPSADGGAPADHAGDDRPLPTRDGDASGPGVDGAETTDPALPVAASEGRAAPRDDRSDDDPAAATHPGRSAAAFRALPHHDAGALDPGRVRAADRDGPG